MLRVVFTAEDLARLRVAREPDALWEITNSVQTLQRRDGRAVFGTWRHAVRPRLGPESRLLASLLPPCGYSPDFLTPGTREPAALDAAVDTMLSTPRRTLAADLERFAAEHGRVPRWAGALADAGGRSGAEPLRRLGGAVRAYYDTAVAPYWSRVHAHVDADRNLRLHALLDGGAEGLLASLGPHFRWRPPVLEVAYPVDQELRLEGRGLLLQPSYFCWPAPVSLADPERPPVLVYPVSHERGDGGPPTGDGLGELLGRTRAALLRATGCGSSTTELARLLDVTGPAVSQHTAVLRENGLLVTVRKGGRSFHSVTAQGRALIHAAEHGSLQ
ncbi:winged helix-turn-helix domain-containing protein [Streptomyces albiaxialis]|uniref:Winged helix-turn-helix domain-containing protein n=1 Tax=Streptomyces albiaxialis TaxID=329523 RepID=A0ABP5HW84_9ACTN